MYAPIVAFVYNRLDHVKALFESLGACELASVSDLFIFSDGSKSESGVPKIEAVRKYIHSVEVKRRFKSVTIIEAEKNKGLARSVISGVTQVIQKYGKAIVIEDDNVVSKQLLRFMNACLDRYESDSSVWSISGYTFKDDIINPEEDVFFSGRPNSYLWGTWKDRWEKIDWNVDDYRAFRFGFLRRHQFNRFGNDASGMLDDQMCGNIDSWAIRFHYACFCNDGYVVMPNKTFSVNLGNDGSGTHVKTFGQKDSRVMDGKIKNYRLPDPYKDKRVVVAYNHKNHRKLFYRVYRYIKAVLLGIGDKK